MPHVSECIMISRISALKQIMKTINDDEIVLSSAGHLSRDLYSVKDRPLNFYVLGSMGACLPVAIGIALNTKREVHAVIGDGEALMNLSSLVLMNNLLLPNLRLIILDNNCYESTGSQRTISNSVNFRDLCDCLVIKINNKDSKSSRIPLTHERIKERFMNAIQS